MLPVYASSGRGACATHCTAASSEALPKLGLAMRGPTAGLNAHRPWLGESALVSLRFVLTREGPHARRGVRALAGDDARARAAEFVTDGRAYRPRPHSLHAA